MQKEPTKKAAGKRNAGANPPRKLSRDELKIRAAVDEVAQGLEPAHGFFDLKLMPRRNDRDTGAVIAAVFQTGEAVEQNGGSLLAADVSNNTTHK